jgi:hypothetical protein
MFPTASNATPSASATNTIQNIVKEQSMDSSTPSITNSNPHNEPPAAPALAAGEKSKKSRKAVPFDPTSSLEAAKELLAEAEDRRGASIRAGAGAVQTLSQDLVSASARRGVVVVAVARARTELEPFAARVVRATTPAVATLRKHTVGGKEIVRQCKKTSPLGTAEALLGRLREGSLEVNAADVQALEHATAAAQPAKTALDDVLKDQAKVERAYTVAKRRLDASVMLLRARLKGQTAESKWSALVGGTSAPPAPAKKKRGKSKI